MTELVDSGIEWLGLIPSYWKIIKLKFIGTCRNGLTYSPNDVVDKGEGTLILTLLGEKSPTSISGGMNRHFLLTI